jgi:predicted TIM-barrel fold metal-dependent hydrolase
MLPKSLISADSHVVERQSAFMDIDPKFRDRIPYETTTEQEGAALVIDGLLTMGYGRSVGAGRPLQDLGKKIAWADVNPAAFDSSTRLEVQDQDGVRAEVIFPTVGMFLHGHPDIDYAKACLDAYNRWMVEYCSRDPERLIGVAQISLRTVRDGLVELEAAKSMGYKAVMLPGEPLEEDYHHPMYDEFWSACEQFHLPVNFHILSSRAELNAARTKTRGPHICGHHRFVRGNQDVISLFIFGGVFERHPKLQIVAVESDASWVPHFLTRMDNSYNRYFYMENVTLPRLPSEYFRENVYVTMQDDYPVGQMTHILPMERVLWANDFPHGDAIWPYSSDVLRRLTQDMSDDHIKMIVHDNVAKLYGLTV